jgi:chromosomal replication initiator protein
LEASLGNDAFTNWIAPIEFKKLEDGIAYFAAPTNFIGNWVKNSYGLRIRELFLEYGARVDRLAFAVAQQSSRKEPTSRPTASASGGQSGGFGGNGSEAGNGGNWQTLDSAGSQLYERFKFENFVVGRPNELAYAAAKRVAESPTVRFNPLFLYGGSGLGKTHLMQAIAWEIRSTRPEAKVMYLSAEQFMHRFVQALRRNDTLSFKELFRSVDVLMVDDVQFIAGKNSTQQEFFDTFNALVDQNKQIVISADRAPGDIEIGERITSRLQWGMVVDVHPTDYELRLSIIEAKAEVQRESYPEVEVMPGVFKFLAQRISSNVRVLEGALTRLFAFGSLAGKPVSLEMAQECLSDVLRASDRKVTIDEIIRKIATHYNLKVNDILSARRARAVARPRQVGMYLAKNLTANSLPEIGRRFGGRDHTTVMHAVKKINELKATDSSIEEDIELLRRSLEA